MNGAIANLVPTVLAFFWAGISLIVCWLIYSKEPRKPRKVGGIHGDDGFDYFMVAVTMLTAFYLVFGR